MSIRVIYCVAVFAFGTTMAAAQSPQVAPAKSQSPTKICQKITPTGSMLPKKFYMTAAEWKEFTKRANSGADQFLARRGSGMCSGSITDCSR